MNQDLGRWLFLAAREGMMAHSSGRSCLPLLVVKVGEEEGAGGRRQCSLLLAKEIDGCPRYELERAVLRSKFTRSTHLLVGSQTLSGSSVRGVAGPKKTDLVTISRRRDSGYSTTQHLLLE